MRPSSEPDQPAQGERHPVAALVRKLREDHLLLLLLAGLVPLSVLAPATPASYPALVDWPTISALTGLLVLTKALEVSGALHALGRWLIGFMTTERAAAVCLVLAAALLSTVLTNDVALFVMVPLTLGVCRGTRLPVTRLVIFEALAVNAGSALTPIGNPQNLFLWHLSKVPFGTFILHMAPLVAMLMAALVALTAWVFDSTPLQTAGAAARSPPDRVLLGVSLGLYLPFLVATDLHYANLAVLPILLVFALLRPRVLALVDWGLLLVFVLMFIDLRLLVHLDLVREGLDGLGLGQPRHLYLAGIAASQLVSNVPAAIALAGFSGDWRVIAYGVNVGGFGFVLGSMANLIALRLSGERGTWLRFHAYAIPFLGIAALMGYAILFVGRGS